MDQKPNAYQVIARKYRPQTFDSVVGQEAVVATLKNALKFNRLAHAYLFCGCRGTGKTTLARVFAKALNCSNPTESFEPCNQCRSCQDILGGRSLDVLEIDGASNRGIDDIRQINETIGYAPASGKYKIYIIDEVHMLTKEAFNALLKTLEEPPANVKFFFATTEPHKVLPTIISRCQRFDLSRIPLEALKKKLAWIAQDLGIPCEEDVFSLIAHLSEGSLRDAESILDQILCCAEHPITAAKVSSILGFLPQGAFFTLDKAFAEQNLSYAFELADEIFSSGKDLSYFLDTLIEHYRTLLKLKIGSPVHFFNQKNKEQLTTSAELFTEEQCLYILDYLLHWQQQIGKTPFKRVSIEMILLHIIRSKFRITLPALTRRLHELSTGQAPQPVTQAAHPKPEPLPEPVTQAAPPKPEPLPEPVIQASPPKPEPLPEPVIQAVPLKPEPTPELVIQAVPLKPEPVDTSLEDALLQKLQEKIAASPAKPASPMASEPTPQDFEGVIITSSVPEKKQEIPAPPAEISFGQQARYDTLMRFAAVELEGILKKESPNG